jgi:hypothetical protein
MFRISLIAATLAASLAAASAAPREDSAAGDPPDFPVAEPQDRAPPLERRRHREPRPRYQGYRGAGVLSGHRPQNRAVDAYSGAVVGEWNYGQPPREAPAPSQRGLHDGLWYY